MVFLLRSEVLRKTPGVVERSPWKGTLFMIRIIYKSIKSPFIFFVFVTAFFSDPKQSADRKSSSSSRLILGIDAVRTRFSF